MRLPALTAPYVNFLQALNGIPIWDAAYGGTASSGTFNMPSGVSYNPVTSTAYILSKAEETSVFRTHVFHRNKQLWGPNHKQSRPEF